MNGQVIDFPCIPRRLCAMCERQATRTLPLWDENNERRGSKFLCDDYPHCGTPGVIETD